MKCRKSPPDPCCTRISDKCQIRREYIRSARMWKRAYNQMRTHQREVTHGSGSGVTGCAAERVAACAGRARAGETDAGETGAWRAAHLANAALPLMDPNARAADAPPRSVRPPVVRMRPTKRERERETTACLVRQSVLESCENAPPVLCECVCTCTLRGAVIPTYHKAAPLLPAQREGVLRHAPPTREAAAACEAHECG